LNIWQNSPVIAGVFASMMFLAVRQAKEKGATRRSERRPHEPRMPDYEPNRVHLFL